MISSISLDDKGVEVHLTFSQTFVDSGNFVGKEISKLFCQVDIRRRRR